MKQVIVWQAVVKAPGNQMSLISLVSELASRTKPKL